MHNEQAVDGWKVWLRSRERKRNTSNSPNYHIPRQSYWTLNMKQYHKIYDNSRNTIEKEREGAKSIPRCRSELLQQYFPFHGFFMSNSRPWKQALTALGALLWGLVSRRSPVPTPLRVPWRVPRYRRRCIPQRVQVNTQSTWQSLRERTSKPEGQVWEVGRQKCNANLDRGPVGEEK